ncbi:late protein [human papillomavirus 40]|uniref:Major capsid protein L1 n=6 Tax=Papillomaviridae TaxID=151340 RepID=VL1_HPV40|nr:RecName: Full=Major capsid protein L1 [human papillomavirus 40]WBM83402.1 L1 protein [human papillomavirus 40]CAA52572.1 late protein [human papillomavirus 40]CCG58310.1 major capsid protein [human papillomavirus 40]CCG58313.1 major capsid protein [human papillomavirus 40]CCG58318.1 major capsid protein [human papillomavirus 40]
MWQLNENQVYLPPPTPVATIVSTDEYVQRTSLYYHAGSARLLTIGHPYFELKKPNGDISVPKVSGHQYRVFRVRLPDPNKFGLSDTSLFNSETQRLVWACVGVEVGRGQPLGVGVSGHPYFNKDEDVENSSAYGTGPGQDSRENVAMDYKQTQLCMLGCTPPIGEYWGKGTPCNASRVTLGDCPVLELKTEVIQDGDMVDTGFGAMDFASLQANKSDVPLDLCTSISKYPDYLGMAAEPYGNSLFFFLRREQMFVRHFFNRAGTTGDSVPTDLYITGTSGRTPIAGSIYYSTPSGSLVTSDSQIFNKPLWIQKAQGHNNGICFGNQLFVTVVDTTRSTNLTLCAATQSPTPTPYNNSNFKEYLRHGEEFDLQFIFQLCVITLNAEVMTYIHAMDPTLLEDWNFKIAPPASASLEDTYRFLTNKAIACQRDAPPKVREDPYKKYKFWDVNLTERFSSQLDQFPLGRKFLMQAGVRAGPRFKSRKRPAPSSSSSSKPVTPKRKKTKR